MGRFAPASSNGSARRITLDGCTCTTRTLEDWMLLFNVHAKASTSTIFSCGSGSAAPNRSMGLDTECDLAIEAVDERTRNEIASVRDRLLAEHLGVPSQRVTEGLEQLGSMAGVVEALASEGRGLRPLPPESSWVEPMLPDSELVDPEKPVTRPYDRGVPTGRATGLGASSAPGRRFLDDPGRACRGLAVDPPRPMVFTGRPSPSGFTRLRPAWAAPLWVLAIYVAGVFSPLSRWSC